MVALNNPVDESLVTFRTSQGLETRASLLRLSRHAAAIEIYSPDVVLRTSEVLSDFRIMVHDRTVYSGRTVIAELLNAGTVTVCEALLDDSFLDTEFFAALGQKDKLSQHFAEFIAHWEKECKVLPEFKVIVADIQTFLISLRGWLEQVELGIRSSPKLDRMLQERSVINELSQRIVSVLDDLFGKFEEIAARLEEDQRPLHRTYIQHHLHPIVLCAPFAYRSYQKPLGYAGDYEIVNMMLRDPQEGSSLFAKAFNVWLLQQGTATAHRNRIKFLKERILEETARAARAGRRANILNIGCGPAWEIQEFMAETQLSNSALFTLMDFNEETLQYAAQVLRQKQQQFHRTSSVELVKKSVQQLLKGVFRTDSLSPGSKYDLIYCAGLFDYLPDRTCKRLMTLLYQSLAPGGLVLTTNVAPNSPNRGSLELILDWHLIYRDVAKLEALGREEVPPEALRVRSDETGLNLFLEARKTDET
jgi:extracellular factor (EF) 3-hydroxypalmitic acid methyl ester biosynthesis protein